MKKIIYLLLIISLQSAIINLHAQWVQQYTASSNLLDVSFVNQNTGWASGDGGLIIKTTNGGINWTVQISGTTNRLEGIHAVDSQYVYCVGWWQTILKTTNSGINWIAIRNGPQPPPQVGSFYGLYFLNRNTGWMLRNNYILRTTNGGNSFDSSYVIYSYLRDIYFKDYTTGILCGDGSLIMKSTDGGLVWNFVTIPQTTTESPDFYKESFIGNTGWVVGAGTNVPGLGPLTWRTTNFGSTWDTIGRVPYPYTHLNYCVFFSSLNTGWCGGTYGHIFKTTNGGFNWFEQAIPIDGFRRSFWFSNDSVGWVVGGGGYVLHTTNGGTYVNVQQINTELPQAFNLYQNYPNPFNSQTEIEFDITRNETYKMEIYDVLGRKVEEIFSKYLTAGKYNIKYNALKLSSGIYFYKLSNFNTGLAKKFTFLK